MPITLPDVDLSARVAALDPYLRSLLDAAAEFANQLHAEEIAPPHLLATILRDEESAAARAVVHAFADPEVIAMDVLALCPGILVASSSGSLPFSARGLAALQMARAEAAQSAAPGVSPTHIWRAAIAHFSEELRGELPEGCRAIPAPPAGEGTRIPDAGPLFTYFTTSSRKALGAACRGARGRGGDAIRPAHLALAAMELDADLRKAVGMSVSGLQMLLGAGDDGPDEVSARDLEPDEELTELLLGLADGADSLTAIARFLVVGSSELRHILTRQKVTPALVERVRSTFRD